MSSTNFFPGAKYLTTSGLSDDLNGKFSADFTTAVDLAFERHEATGAKVIVKDALTGEWLCTIEDNDMTDAIDNLLARTS